MPMFSQQTLSYRNHGRPLKQLSNLVRLAATQEIGRKMFAKAHSIFVAAFVLHSGVRAAWPNWRLAGRTMHSAPLRLGGLVPFC